MMRSVSIITLVRLTFFTPFRSPVFVAPLAAWHYNERGHRDSTVELSPSHSASQVVKLHVGRTERPSEFLKDFFLVSESVYEQAGETFI